MRNAAIIVIGTFAYGLVLGWWRSPEMAVFIAMGKAVEYGVPRYVMYDVKRDGADPMFNLSREEILKGAKILDCESDCKLINVRSCGSQLEFVM